SSTCSTILFMPSVRTTAGIPALIVEAGKTGRLTTSKTAARCGKSSSQSASISRTQPRMSSRRESSETPSFLCSNLLQTLPGGSLMHAPKSLLAFLLVAMTCAGQEARDPKPLAPSSTSAPTLEFASAALLLRQGKYDEAIAELQSLAAKKPAPKNLARELGAAYYQKGDYLKAAEYLKTAQSEDPEDNESIQLLGLSYYLAGRPAEAIPHLEKVQSWFPRANVDAAYILGICYIQSKDYPK